MIIGTRCGEKLIWVNPHEAEDALVQRAVEVILAVCAGEGGAALVEHPWQQRVAAEARARAAGRTLREVGRAQLCHVRGYRLVTSIS